MAKRGRKDWRQLAGKRPLLWPTLARIREANSPEAIKGMRLARQGRERWEELKRRLASGEAGA